MKNSLIAITTSLLLFSCNSKEKMLQEINSLQEKETSIDAKIDFTNKEILRNFLELEKKKGMV